MTDSHRTGFSQRIVTQLYRKGSSSKTDLAAELGISMPTVLQCVKQLMDKGLVIQSGQVASRGGRRADALTLCGESRQAIGVDITKNHLSLVVVSLKGELTAHERLSLPFSKDASYLGKVAGELERFRALHQLTPERLLGVGFSLPGILSPDGRTLMDSHALDVQGYALEPLFLACKAPALGINDANAAALAENHLLPDDRNTVYLSLSNSVGGAVWIGGRLYTGDHGRAGEFGHIAIVPDGRACYCGKRGCFDAYGSALLLSEGYGGQLGAFFEALQAGEPRARAIWQEYVTHMALLCNHLRMAFDASVILGGYVGAYAEPYLEQIRREAAKLNTFEPSGHYIESCRYKTEAAATGAALEHIERFIQSI